MHICDLPAATVIERHAGQASSIIDAFRSLRSHHSCQAEMVWSYEAHSSLLDDKFVIDPNDPRTSDEIVDDDSKIAICLLRGRVGPWSVCREISVGSEVMRQIRRKFDVLFKERA